MNWMEPFKIKTVEPINILTEKERVIALEKGGYNLFRLPSDKVTIDFLTDSGTGALSHDQWAMIMKSDEAYAGAKSWERFEKSARSFTGLREIVPVHQGRAAEKLIAELFIKNRGDFIIANTLFDTTRANFEHVDTTCVDFPESDDISSWRNFKGNINIGKAKKFLEKNRKTTRALIMTLTNNSGGGQPASLKNIISASRLARRYGVPFVVDACRIAENAFFIKKLEREFRGKSVGEIIKLILRVSDLAFMSAKKDGLANIGGFIATNDKKMAAALRNLGVLYEGFPTYGGMSGREMETIARGLEEVTDEKYLDYRVGQIKYLHEGLSRVGFALVNPPGGHAVYFDAVRALPHIKKEQFPGQVLALAFYLEGGVRGVEVGSLMFGGVARHELLRFAIPRRVYTKSHLDYVIGVGRNVWKSRKKLRGLKIVSAPKELRHFSATLKLL